MAGNRKSKGETEKNEEKKEGGLDARPDGKVRWSKNMREALAKFNDRPCGRCGGSLSEERSLAESLDFFRRHRSSFYPPRAARLRMLEMHGAAAAELLFEPSPHKEAVTDLLAIHDAEVVRFFVAQVKQIDCKNALVKQAARWPLFVLRELLSANPARHQAGAALVLELLAANPEWQEPLEASCDEAQRKTLARLQEDGSAGVADAPAADWPALLRRPPWKNRQALPVIPVLALQPLPPTARLHWTDLKPPQYLQATGDLSDWLAREVRVSRDRSNQWMTEFTRHQPDAPDAIREGGNLHKALWMLGLRPELIDDVIAGRHEITSPEDFGQLPGSRWGVAEYIWQLPPPLAVAAFTHGPAVDHFMGDVARVRPILHALGTDALPGLPRFLKQGSRAMFELASVIEWDPLAGWIAKGFHTNRWVRREAAAWLERYPDTAARGLVPVALGEPGPAHESAQAALRWLHDNGHADAVRAQAQAYGAEAAGAVAQLLSIAPEDVLPDSLPVVPKTLPLPSLPRLILKEGGLALPQAVVPDVLMAMMLGKPDAPYPGLAPLLDALAPDSLARFGRALLAWWIGNGRPARERWMFALQGRLGDGETARQLYSLLRQWRAGLDRVRAYDAMAMLGEIGSDAALMHLAELARQTRYDDLRTRADRMLGEVAEQRGLSLDQLADRTVPDLGLDARARLTLDFGPRSFEVRMDDSFQPVVHDARGKALKTLPKAGANDDAGKAAAAATQLKELRKLAKTVATTQIRRLEAAMCAQRRWGPDEFMPFFANHPVLRVFSRPLVWGLFDAADKLQGTFRVTAEGELADLHDDPVKLPENARIGLPHPLDFAALDASLVTAWAPVLADYEILQPFEQLARQSFVLDPALRAGRELPQWAGRAVSNAALMGLETRGWVREIGDGGMVNSFNKGVPGEGQVCLRLEEGWFVQDSPDGKVLQTVHGVALTGTERTLGDLPAIAFSEIERDLQRAVRETSA
ncbi:DUF4132 domain-containing protein [Variovorax guangxiensis]|uniref:DUF4132 domain-containing protein n=1 Tax=Variovorax guangxiensis TaxID=1775474 RepID=A0A840FQ32_9BURK|nr:DUF4132 domain-containing protein [Variovorax guangxiensis]MBB4222474.1 hypothetical protein [Variovorax guangxiensis]